MAITVHLVDGTYELFRYHYAPSNRDPERGAVVGVVGSLLGLVEDGATHVGVATDHVIESWRNDLWAQYKTGEGIEPGLKAQFPVLEDVLGAAGFAVWAMVEDEADDALAAAAAVAAGDDRVSQVVICTPDKDLAQCVGGKVVQLDRRKDELRDAAGVRDRFGVDPPSIPDYLALVGDSADGFPGLKGWGAKSAAAVLARYRHIEDIPAEGADWDVDVRNGRTLAATLQRHRDEAMLFRTLATLRTECEVGTVDDWRWSGPRPDLAAVMAHAGIDADTRARLVDRAQRIGASRD